MGDGRRRKMKEERNKEGMKEGEGLRRGKGKRDEGGGGVKKGERGEG